MSWRLQHDHMRRHRGWRLSVLGTAGGGLLLLTAIVPAGIEQHHPFVLFFPYLVFAAWYGDRWDALAATGLSMAGMVRWVWAAAPPVVALGDGAAAVSFLLGALLLILVVDRLRAAQEQAHQAQQQAEEAVRSRNAFLTLVSHDLRTPLTVMRALSDLVCLRVQRGTVQAEDLARHMATLQDATRRMQALLDELTDVAHLQMGRRLTLQRTTLDMGALIQSTAQLVTQASGPDAAPLALALEPAVWVAGDRARLERVLQNILTNALKYSPPDRAVQVRLRVHEGQAIVEMEDHGVGIPPAELPLIGTPFYRASTAGDVPGTGVGLAAARGIVEAHGGRLTLTSRVGTSTCVTLTLPCAPTVSPSRVGRETSV